MFDGPRTDDDALGDARRWGLSDEDSDDIAEALSESTQDGVWPDHAQAVALFLAAGTQWRVAAIGARLRRVGLDYGAIEVLMRAYQVTPSPALWTDLRVLEAGALEAMHGGAA